MAELYKGFIVTAISSLIILYPVTDFVIGFDTTYTIDDKNFNAYEYMINNYRELLTFIKFQKALQIIKERNKKL